MTSDLPKYRSHKIVSAAKILEVVTSDTGAHMLVLEVPREGGTRGVACPVKADLFARYTPEKGDYYVVYEDGYNSISPAKAFEEGYRPLKDMTHPARLPFGLALNLLKAGQRVAREGWNGKGMFLFLVPGSRFTVNRPPLLGIYPEGTEIDYHAHIDMKTAQGYVVPWLASQADLLADDWSLVEKI